MKGIILAGGLGTRLYPLTKSISKQLLPVYDKPMIYYPLSILMLAEIKDILIISTSYDKESYIKLLGSGEKFGLKISYAIQNKPNGIAEAFIIGKDFISNDPVCLILGDNILFGNGLSNFLHIAKKKINQNKSTIFGYPVSNPENYGIAEINQNGELKSITEKPKKPDSNLAVIGIYFYPNSVLDYVIDVKKSNRSELEISTLNQIYLDKNEINLIKLGRGFAWFDAGTPKSLKNASDFIQSIEERHGEKVACLEEIAYSKGYITRSFLKESTKDLGDSDYKKYLINLIKKSK